MKPTNAQPIANRPEAIMSENARTPAPSAANLARANLPTKTSPKAQPSQPHQGKSDGLINIAAIPAGCYLQTLLKAPGARPARLICLHTNGFGYCSDPTFAQVLRAYSLRALPRLSFSPRDGILRSPWRLSGSGRYHDSLANPLQRSHAQLTV
jgi:hypothetical protein